MLVQARIDHSRKNRRISTPQPEPIVADPRRANSGNTTRRYAAPNHHIANRRSPSQATEVVSISSTEDESPQSIKVPLRLRVRSAVGRPSPKVKRCGAGKLTGTHNVHCVRCMCRDSCIERVVVRNSARDGVNLKTRCPHCSSRQERFQTRSMFHMHVQSKGCTLARGEKFEPLHVRASAEERRLAEEGAFFQNGTKYWKCGRCEGECLRVGAWNHILFTCKHRENFRVIHNDPVVSCFSVTGACGEERLQVSNALT